MEKESLKKGKKEDAVEGKLYEDFQRSKPLYADKDSAIRATLAQLEQIAAKAGVTVEAFLKEAHTASDSTPEHILALQLERQLNFLRR